MSSSSAGDAIPQDHRIIEIRVAELRQLFNDYRSIAVSRTRPRPQGRTIHRGMERRFSHPRTVGSGCSLGADSGRRGRGNAILREAMSEYFAQRAIATRRNLRDLFRRGRISLAIALAFLATSIVIGDAIAAYFRESRLAEVIREGFLIGGWVAMWRPIEVFLYDWWPIRAEARLFDRLSKMPVRIDSDTKLAPPQNHGATI